MNCGSTGKLHTTWRTVLPDDPLRYLRGTKFERNLRSDRGKILEHPLKDVPFCPDLGHGNAECSKRRVVMLEHRCPDAQYPVVSLFIINCVSVCPYPFEMPGELPDIRDGVPGKASELPVDKLVNRPRGRKSKNSFLFKRQ